AGGATWSLLSPQFDQTIPSGTYAVVGFEHWSPTSIAARIVFPGSPRRPGTLSQNNKVIEGPNPNVFDANARTHDIFYHGSLGVYGMFQTTAPPSIEVLTTGADASHEGYLRVVRVGDLTGRM